MSNPALLRMLRSGATTDMHVSRDSASAVAQRGNPHVLFSGETYHGRFSMNKSEGHEFQKKETREAGKKKRIYEPGEDADGDGETGEGKGKKDFSDRNKNGKPDFMEKDDSDSESDSEGPPSKKDKKDKD